MYITCFFYEKGNVCRYSLIWSSFNINDVLNIVINWWWCFLFFLIQPSLVKGILILTNSTPFAQFKSNKKALKILHLNFCRCLYNV